MKSYILKITIDETDIWRRLYFPHGQSFALLHEAIQLIFGWKNYHMHEFNVGSLLIFPDDDEDVDDIDEEFKLESDVNLDLFLMNKRCISYLYDYGDEWHVTIEVEDIVDGDKSYAALTDYNGPMLKEDCGGIDGLANAKLKAVNEDKINLILRAMFQN